MVRIKKWLNLLIYINKYYKFSHFFIFLSITILIINMCLNNRMKNRNLYKFKFIHSLKYKYVLNDIKMKNYLLRPLLQVKHSDMGWLWWWL
jgi:hypothetical protein